MFRNHHHSRLYYFIILLKRFTFSTAYADNVVGSKPFFFLLQKFTLLPWTKKQKQTQTQHFFNIQKTIDFHMFNLVILYKYIGN